MPKGEHLKGGKIGVKFGEGQSIVGNGRPRALTSLDGFNSYTPSQIKQIYGYCIALTLDELQALYKDETKEIIWRTTAKFWYETYKTGDYKKIQGIMEQFIGKPSNTVDVTSNGESLASVPDWVRQKKNE
jgi:hypothetical protein